MSNPAVRLYWTAFTAWHTWGDASLPYWPLDRILDRQRRRLRAIVRHAYATVPHYHEAMDRAGLRPGDIRDADELARLPLVSGAEVAETPTRFTSSRYPEDRTLTLRSSGTTGRPKSIRHSAAALFLALAHGGRHRAVLSQLVGRRFGYREMLAARSDSVAVQIRRFYEANAWFPGPVELQRATLPVDVGFDEAVRAINAFAPDVIFGYGSHLGSLYRLAVERGRAIHRPRVIWYGADRCPTPSGACSSGRSPLPCSRRTRRTKRFASGSSANAARAFISAWTTWRFAWWTGRAARSAQGRRARS